MKMTEAFKEKTKNSLKENGGNDKQKMETNQ